MVFLSRAIDGLGYWVVSCAFFVGAAMAAPGFSDWTPDELHRFESWPAQVEGVRVKVWLPEGVRRLTDVDGHVEIYHDGPTTSQIRVTGVQVWAGDVLVARTDVSLDLLGDGGRYGEFLRLAELVPVDESKRYARRSLPLDVHRAFDFEEIRGMVDEMTAIGEAMATDVRATVAPPFGQVDVRLPLDRILQHRAGSVAELKVHVEFEDSAGRRQEAVAEHRIERLPDFPHAPLMIGGSGEVPAFAQAGSWVVGDFHFHDCKDETGFWRGCPSCTAETTDWGVENTLANLHSQYIAAGADFATSTSHSYCLQKEREYEAVRLEVEDLNQDSDFVLLADIELSSEESGSQGCLDLFNAICLLRKGTSHMGAHFINEWMVGGTDLLGGFCFLPMNSVLDNISRVRGQGGLPILNHPCPNHRLGGMLTSNSDDVLTGIRDDGLHGVEIWNGPRQEGQSGHVKWWVDRLLDGHKIFGFSGSDTHDDVYEFGWNHVYVWPDMNETTLQRSVDLGLSYVSNYQYLAVALKEPGGTWVPMGRDMDVPFGWRERSVVLAVGYDMGNRYGTVEIWRGRVGDTEESLIATFTGVTGDGALMVSDSAPTDRSSYYRAYSVAPGYPSEGHAYSNPVWVVPE